MQHEPAGQDDLPAALESGAGSRLLTLALCGLLLLLVAAAFGQTAGFDFVNWDDGVCVYENPHVTGGLSAAGLRWAFTNRDAGIWTPLCWLSHMLDCQLWGLSAGGHHLTNVFLHAATAILLFLVLKRITGRLWPRRWRRRCSRSIPCESSRWPG